MAKGKYQEWITDDGLLILKGYAREGLTNREISKLIGIQEETFSRWVSEYNQINQTLKEGRKPINTILEDTFYNKKLKGYFVDEETTEITIQKDANGNTIGSTEHKRKNRRYIPPDTTAMIFTLKCRMPQKYNDKINNDTDTTALDKLDNIIKSLKDTANKSEETK